MHKLNDIFNMPDVIRRRLKLKKNKRRRKRRKDIKNYTEEELLFFLLDNGIKSSRQLEAIRSQIDDPTVYDYRKRFGSWQNALNQAYGDTQDIIANEITAEYLVRVVVEYNLWTYRNYLEGHKRNENVVPSYHYVIKLFGNWSNLTETAKKYSMNENLKQYVTLWNKLNKKPTLLELSQDKVDIEKLLNYFSTKKELDEFVIQLRDSNEK